jgi:hypothetical protein
MPIPNGCIEKDSRAWHENGSAICAKTRTANSGERVAAAGEEGKTMRRLAMWGIALVLGACGGSSTSVNLPETYKATLSGAGEFPPVTNQPTATGTATFVNDGTKTTYTITGSGLSGTPILSHIHLVTTTGTAGGVIVPFSVAGSTANAVNITGSFTEADILLVPSIGRKMTYDELTAQMRSGNIYANVHTNKNPTGEMAGILKLQ